MSIMKTSHLKRGPFHAMPNLSLDPHPQHLIREGSLHEGLVP
jgi:hypothetical protein